MRRVSIARGMDGMSTSNGPSSKDFYAGLEPAELEISCWAFGILDIET